MKNSFWIRLRVDIDRETKSAGFKNSVGEKSLSRISIGNPVRDPGTGSIGFGDGTGRRRRLFGTGRDGTAAVRDGTAAAAAGTRRSRILICPRLANEDGDGRRDASSGRARLDV